MPDPDRRDESDDALLQVAALAADGRSSGDADALGGEGRRVAQNLSRLAALKAAFDRLDAAPASGVEAQAQAALGSWGHLTLQAELGRGGFGVVYRAFDPILQREVALKLQREDIDAARAGSWIEEARRLARVRHPNVLAVHGADVNEGRAGLWSDLLQGETLAARLQREPGLQRPALIGLLRQLASALDAIHAAGLVHGDVKPENVMLEGGQAVLMDFGAAAQRGATPRFGTPGAMAPELLAGGRASGASDVYSLGVLLGRAALPADGREARTPEAVERDLRRRLGAPLQRLLRRLTGEQPAARPTPSAILAELDRIEALPRRRARRLALGLVIASLLLGLAFAALGLQRARQAQAVAEAERQRAEAVNAFLVGVLAAPQATREGEQVRVVELLDQAEAQLSGGGDDAPPQVRADLWQVLGRSFDALGRSEDALAALDAALQLRTRLHGSEDLRTLEVERLRIEAQAYAGDAQARIDAAEALHRRALAVAGPRHPLPALIEARIGRDYAGLGDLESARRWLEPAYRRREGLDWAAPIDRVVIELHWLQLLQRLGEVDAMLEGARAARVLVEAEAGPRHASALIARNLEIGALLQRGRLAEAEQAAREQHAIAAPWLGEDHAYAITALSSLASAVSDQGRTREAVELHQRVYLAKQRVHGAQHANTLVSALNLANALRAEGEREDAERLYRKVIDTLPERSDIALLARGNLAQLQVEAGDYATAKTTASAALERMQTALGDEHLFTQHARSMLGAAELGLGRVEAALALLEPASAGIARYLGERHLVALEARYWLALALLEAGERARAAVLLDAVLEQRRAQLGEAHPKTVLAQQARERTGD